MTEPEYEGREWFRETGSFALENYVEEIYRDIDRLKKRRRNAKTKIRFAESMLKLAETDFTVYTSIQKDATIDLNRSVDTYLDFANTDLDFTKKDLGFIETDLDLDLDLDHTTEDFNFNFNFGEGAFKVIDFSYPDQYGRVVTNENLAVNRDDFVYLSMAHGTIRSVCCIDGEKERRIDDFEWLMDGGSYCGESPLESYYKAL